MSPEQFPLWTFRTPNGSVVITRGQTVREAECYVARYFSGVTPLWSNSIHAARQYSTNHEPGWLNRPMRWLAGDV